MILEPDALANMTCLSTSDQLIRVRLLKDAISVLEAKHDVAVYIDAGHPNWVSASVMAQLLNEVDIASVQGFALNVSSFGTVADNIAFGRQISSLVGDKHFVIDTRVMGSDRLPMGMVQPARTCTWPRATTETDDALADAYLWIKPPGESDGTCNGGPVAGAWCPNMHLVLRSVLLTDHNFHVRGHILSPRAVPRSPHGMRSGPARLSFGTPGAPLDNLRCTFNSFGRLAPEAEKLADKPNLVAIGSINRAGGCCASRFAVP